MWSIMHKDKIICEVTKDIGKLNEMIDNANEEGFNAIDISMASRGGEYYNQICVLLCKKDK